MNKNIFLKKFNHWNFQRKLIKAGDKIIVGFSGGPDSTALVLLLKILAQKKPLDLFLIHINYGLRGKDSQEDEIFVKDFAHQNRLSLKIIKYKKLKKIDGNLEENLRNFRYREFEKVRRQKKYDFIAVGHTVDDKTETLLMNLIRGAGLAGITSLSEKNKKIIRPLLIFEKKEILSFLKSQKQKYRIDKSNLNPKFLRNKIRKELIPLLEKKYNRQIKKNLITFSENLKKEKNFLDQITDFCYNQAIGNIKHRLHMTLSKTSQLPESILKNIFRKVILELSGNLKNISLANYKEFKKILTSQKSKSQKMEFKNIKIVRRRNTIYFSKK